MNINTLTRQMSLGGLAIAALMVTTTISPEAVQAEGIIDRLNMLESAGSSSESGINPADFDIAVIDTMIEQLMSMAETTMVGMMSDDPEIAEMSAQMMEMIEAELEHLNEVRRAKLGARLQELRSSTSESGIR